MSSNNSRRTTRVPRRRSVGGEVSPNQEAISAAQGGEDNTSSSQFQQQRAQRRSRNFKLSNTFMTTSPEPTQVQQANFKHQLGKLRNSNHFHCELPGREEEAVAQDIGDASVVLLREALRPTNDGKAVVNGDLLTARLAMPGPAFNERAQSFLERPIGNFNKDDVWRDWMALRGEFITLVRTFAIRFRTGELDASEIAKVVKVGSSFLHAEMGVVIHVWASASAANRFQRGWHNVWTALFMGALRGINAPLSVLFEIQGRYISVSAPVPLAKHSAVEATSFPNGEPRTILAAMAQQLALLTHSPLGTSFVLHSGIDGRHYLLSCAEVISWRVGPEAATTARPEALRLYLITAKHDQAGLRALGHVSDFVSEKLVPLASKALVDAIAALPSEDQNCAKVISKELIPAILHGQGVNMVLLPQVEATLMAMGESKKSASQAVIDAALESVRTEMLCRLMKHFVRIDVLSNDTTASSRIDVVNRIMRLLLSKNERFWLDHVVPGFKRKYGVMIGFGIEQTQSRVVLKYMSGALGARFKPNEGRFNEFIEITAMKVLAFHEPEARRSGKLADIFWADVSHVPAGTPAFCAFEARAAVATVICHTSGSSDARQRLTKAIQAVDQQGDDDTQQQKDMYPGQEFHLARMFMIQADLITASKKSQVVREMEDVLQDLVTGVFVEERVAWQHDATLLLHAMAGRTQNRTAEELPADFFAQCMLTLSQRSEVFPGRSPAFIAAARDMCEVLRTSWNKEIIAETLASLVDITRKMRETSCRGDAVEFFYMITNVALAIKDVHLIYPKLLPAVVANAVEAERCFGPRHHVSLLCLLNAIMAVFDVRLRGTGIWRSLEKSFVIVKQVLDGMQDYPPPKLLAAGGQTVPMAVMHRASSWCVGTPHVSLVAPTKRIMSALSPKLAALFIIQSVGKGTLARKHLSENCPPQRHDTLSPPPPPPPGAHLVVQDQSRRRPSTGSHETLSMKSASRSRSRDNSPNVDQYQGERSPMPPAPDATYQTHYSENEPGVTEVPATYGSAYTRTPSPMEDDETDYRAQSATQPTNRTSVSQSTGSSPQDVRRDEEIAAREAAAAAQAAAERLTIAVQQLELAHQRGAAAIEHTESTVRWELHGDETKDLHALQIELLKKTIRKEEERRRPAQQPQQAPAARATPEGSSSKDNSTSERIVVAAAAPVPDDASQPSIETSFINQHQEDTSPAPAQAPPPPAATVAEAAASLGELPPLPDLSGLTAAMEVQSAALVDQHEKSIKDDERRRKKQSHVEQEPLEDLGDAVLSMTAGSRTTTPTTASPTTPTPTASEKVEHTENDAEEDEEEEEDEHDNSSAVTPNVSASRSREESPAPSEGSRFQSAPPRAAARSVEVAPSLPALATPVSTASTNEPAPSAHEEPAPVTSIPPVAAKDEPAPEGSRTEDGPLEPPPQPKATERRGTKTTDTSFDSAKVSPPSREPSADPTAATKSPTEVQPVPTEVITVAEVPTQRQQRTSPLPAPMTQPRRSIDAGRTSTDALRNRGGTPLQRQSPMQDSLHSLNSHSGAGGGPRRGPGGLGASPARPPGLQGPRLSVDYSRTSTPNRSPMTNSIEPVSGLRNLDYSIASNSSTVRASSPANSSVGPAVANRARLAALRTQLLFIDSDANAARHETERNERLERVVLEHGLRDGSSRIASQEGEAFNGAREGLLDAEREDRTEITNGEVVSRHSLRSRYESATTTLHQLLASQAQARPSAGEPARAQHVDRPASRPRVAQDSQFAAVAPMPAASPAVRRKSMSVDASATFSPLPPPVQVTSDIDESSIAPVSETIPLFDERDVNEFEAPHEDEPARVASSRSLREDEPARVASSRSLREDEPTSPSSRSSSRRSSAAASPTRAVPQRRAVGDYRSPARTVSFTAGVPPRPKSSIALRQVSPERPSPTSPPVATAEHGVDAVDYEDEKARADLTDRVEELSALVGEERAARDAAEQQIQYEREEYAMQLEAEHEAAIDAVLDAEFYERDVLIEIATESGIQIRASAANGVAVIAEKEEERRLAQEREAKARLAAVISYLEADEQHHRAEVVATEIESRALFHEHERSERGEAHRLVDARHSAEAAQRAMEAERRAVVQFLTELESSSRQQVESNEESLRSAIQQDRHMDRVELDDRIQAKRRAEAVRAAEESLVNQHRLVTREGRARAMVEDEDMEARRAITNEARDSWFRATRAEEQRLVADRREALDRITAELQHVFESETADRDRVFALEAGERELMQSGSEQSRVDAELKKVRRVRKEAQLAEASRYGDRVALEAEETNEREDSVEVAEFKERRALQDLFTENHTQLHARDQLRQFMNASKELIELRDSEEQQRASLAEEFEFEMYVTLQEFRTGLWTARAKESLREHRKKEEREEERQAAVTKASGDREEVLSEERQEREFNQFREQREREALAKAAVADRYEIHVKQKDKKMAEFEAEVEERDNRQLEEARRRLEELRAKSKKEEESPERQPQPQRETDSRPPRPTSSGHSRPTSAGSGAGARGFASRFKSEVARNRGNSDSSTLSDSDDGNRTLPPSAATRSISPPLNDSGTPFIVNLGSGHDEDLDELTAKLEAGGIKQPLALGLPTPENVGAVRDTQPPSVAGSPTRRKPSSAPLRRGSQSGEGFANQLPQNDGINVGRLPEVEPLAGGPRRRPSSALDVGARRTSGNLDTSAPVFGVLGVLRSYGRSHGGGRSGDSSPSGLSSAANSRPGSAASQFWRRRGSRPSAGQKL